MGCFHVQPKAEGFSQVPPVEPFPAAFSTMVEVVGQSVRVVDTGLLSIDELAGNVATSNDRISIALVKVAEPTSEPWLTLHYDEWMCVLKGRMVPWLPDEDAQFAGNLQRVKTTHLPRAFEVLLHGDKKVEVLAGQTVFIAKGLAAGPRGA
eukprot:Skav209417  [mRNA]  locus=scaffold1411:201431:209169:+ [translate_table: standard]